MTNLISIHGSARFEYDDVSIEEDGPQGTGPFPSWMLFTWYVNEMVPETFATMESNFTVHYDIPQPGWVTEEYDTALIVRPPKKSGETVLIQSKTPSLYHVWDVAMQRVVAGSIHKH